MIAHAVLLMALALLGLTSCATSPAANAQRTWVLWAVHQDLISSPEILRPIETYRTKQECEAYKAVQVRLQLARFEQLDRENRSRATEAGIVVKNLRAERGWTQEELADRAGIMHRVISQIESGTPIWGADMEAFKLAKAFGVSVKELDKLGEHFPRNIVTQTQCWPDTVDPRGPKAK
jgi:putative transcriptional regulator